jgi:transcriptional regulator with XRE-family HTH domain
MTAPRTRKRGTPRLAKLVSTRRKKLGLSMRQLSIDTGKSRAFLNGVEDGTEPITNEETVQTIAGVLQVDPDEIYAAGDIAPHDIVRDIAMLPPHKLKIVRENVHDLRGRRTSAT